MKTRAFGILKIRTCNVCHHSDFADCLSKVGVRHYKHSEKWQARCEWFTNNPNSSLSDAKAANLHGVSHI